MKTVSEAVNYRRSVRKYDTRPIDTQIVKNCIEEASLSPNSSNMQLWEFHHIESSEILKKLSVACFNQNAAKTAKQMLVVVVRKDLWKKRVKSNSDFIEKSFDKDSKNQHPKIKKQRIDYYKKTMPFVYGDFLGLFGIFKKILAWSIGWFRPIYRQLGSSDMRVVAHKSAGLASQTFMLSMAARGYDTCPMEGFDSKKVKKILNLPFRSEVNMIISCGIRIPEGIYGERFRIPFDEVYKKW